MWRCLVSVSAMMCGSECAVSSFCRSMIVVCITRVFSVRALRFWCEYGVLGWGVGGRGWLLRLDLSGFLSSSGWDKFWVS